MDKNDAVEKLIQQAANAKEAHVAMNFAQAALNAAHARQVVRLGLARSGEPRHRHRLLVRCDVVPGWSPLMLCQYVYHRNQDG